MKKTEKSEQFYVNLISLLLEKKINFMIGGTYAFTAYTGIKRATKDMDIFTTVNDYPKVLKICTDAGYKTDLKDQTWIAKIHKNSMVVDIIFAEKNGSQKVTKEWFTWAKKGEILGFMVNLMPLEEMISSKSYLQNRDRYDGPDVTHLFLCQGKQIDWKRLVNLMNNNWEVLFAHIINFLFVYPNAKNNVPSWVLDDYQKKLQQIIKDPTANEKVTRGLLLSSLYKVAIELWGYTDISNTKISYDEQE